MKRRLHSAMPFLAAGCLLLPAPATASEPVIEALARLSEAQLEGEVSGWEGGNLIQLQRDPDGQGVAYTISDCVVQGLHLDATPDGSPRTSIGSFDLNRLERVRFIPRTPTIRPTGRCRRSIPR